MMQMHYLCVALFEVLQIVIDLVTAKYNFHINGCCGCRFTLYNFNILVDIHNA